MPGPESVILLLTVMDPYRLKLDAPWEEVKEMLKEINLELTDEDLECGPGGDQELLERLARKMNKDVFDVKAWIESVSYNRGLAY
jgi:hypothetical protein